MKRLTLIGTKEFSEQIIAYANRTGEFEFVGYFDDLAQIGSIINGKPVLGKVKDAVELYKQGVFDCIFEGIGYTRFDLREYYYNLLKGKVPFANIIMPQVIFEENVTIGEGIFIGEDSVIGQNTIIEDNVFIHSRTFFAHDNKVGKHSYLAGRVDTAGFCEIGERNFIGVRSLFSDHIKTCADVWVGIGCIVVKDILAPGKYMTRSVTLLKVE